MASLSQNTKAEPLALTLRPSVIIANPRQKMIGEQGTSHEAEFTKKLYFNSIDHPLQESFLDADTTACILSSLKEERPEPEKLRFEKPIVEEVDFAANSPIYNSMRVFLKLSSSLSFYLSIYLSFSQSLLSLRDRERADTKITFHHPHQHKKLFMDQHPNHWKNDLKPILFLPKKHRVNWGHSAPPLSAIL